MSGGWTQQLESCFVKPCPAGTTTTCPCRTPSTRARGGATTTTPAPCPRAHTGGWRGHVSSRVFTCRVQAALLPDPGQQRDLRADDPLGRPHGRLRRGRVRGRCARPVPGGCCRGPGEVSSVKSTKFSKSVHNTYGEEGCCHLADNPGLQRARPGGAARHDPGRGRGRVDGDHGQVPT